MNNIRWRAYNILTSNIYTLIDIKNMSGNNDTNIIIAAREVIDQEIICKGLTYEECDQLVNTPAHYREMEQYHMKYVFKNLVFTRVVFDQCDYRFSEEVFNNFVAQVLLNEAMNLIPRIIADVNAYIRDNKITVLLGSSPFPREITICIIEFI